MSGHEISERSPDRRRIFVLVGTVACIGLVLQLWLWQRGRLDISPPGASPQVCGVGKYDRDSFLADQLKLLLPGVERAEGAPLAPFTKRMSGGGIVPGSLLQILIGEPLRLWRDYRSASAVIVLFHLLAGGLVLSVARRAGDPTFGAFFFALFWLSPWRLYHGGFLWEPAYVLLPAALHLWAHQRLAPRDPADKPGIGASLFLALALASASQLHASAVVLFLITGWLFFRRQVRLHVPGFGLGLLLGALPLVPTLLAAWEGSLDLVDDEHPTHTERNLLRLLYRLPRALGYWIRVGSLDLGRRYRQTDFLEDFPLGPAKVLAFGVSVIALLSAIAVAWAGWRWYRDRKAASPATDAFLHVYAGAGFFAVLSAAVLSPITLQGWHVLIALPAAIVPVAYGLTELVRARPRWTRWIVGLLVLAQVACILLIGLGHPMYGRPEGPCIDLSAEEIQRLDDAFQTLTMTTSGHTLIHPPASKDSTERNTMFDRLVNTIRSWIAKPQPETDDFLFATPSPYGTVEALVEQDDSTAYFYLGSLETPEQTFRGCWIRNLRPAPPDSEADEKSEMPMLSREHCRHPKGAEPLEADRLNVLWLPSGDGAALYEDEQLLAFIPFWTPEDSIFGYARDAKERSRFVWDLESAQGEIEKQLRDAEAFWQSWSTTPTPWAQHRPRYLEALKDAFGPHSRYAAIDGGVPPRKGLAIFEDIEGMTFAITVGLSLYPQPRDRFGEDGPLPSPRIELAMVFSADISEDVLNSCLGEFSGLTNLPWARLNSLEHGDTVVMSCYPPAPNGSEFPAAILTAHPSNLVDVELPEVSDEPVQLLWLIPITAEERTLAVQQGSEALLDFFDGAVPIRF